MRTLLLSLSAVFMLCLPPPAESGRDLKAIHKVFTEPVPLDKSADSTMHILFRHAQHKTIRCTECHHTVANGAAYTSCSTDPGCHDTSSVSTDPQSRFQAFHSRGNERSCYACHIAQRARFDRAMECTICHAKLKNQ